ncbi:MAG TPA: type II toxin-antitoxin system death-on-curing family toxin [Opitutus sp.]|nr:type II toxin-antitoxin system death-on-curing family toxin [Opitutus sp.]
MSAREQPLFLSLETVHWLHQESLRQHGGLDGVRDAAAMEAALGAAQDSCYYGGGDQFDIAAAYAFHLAQSQAFLDGNKRTAIACALTLIGRPSPNQDDLYDAMIAIAERRMDKAGLAAVLRRQFSKL